MSPAQALPVLAVFGWASASRRSWLCSAAPRTRGPGWRAGSGKAISGARPRPGDDPRGVVVGLTVLGLAAGPAAAGDVLAHELGNHGLGPGQRRRSLPTSPLTQPVF